MSRHIKKAENHEVTALLSICFKPCTIRSVADYDADIHTFGASVSFAGRARSQYSQRSCDYDDRGNAAQTGNKFIHIYSGK